MRVLVSWIGMTDLRVASGDTDEGLGPLAQAVEVRGFDRLELLHDQTPDDVAGFFKWLQAKTTAELHSHHCPLDRPTDYEAIYVAAVKVLKSLTQEHQDKLELTMHLSPGTPAMAAVWLLLGKTSFPAELIESSKSDGVLTTNVPFDISADFIPSLLAEPDRRLAMLSEGLPPATPAFEEIRFRSEVMRRVVTKARVVAQRSLSVLIEGESGTGKELLARAIHSASPRNDRDIVPVNCGAIPDNLVESELFGHEKGAFTGATTRRCGKFEEADGSTLFLDEIGELPMQTQVKLLRVLQEGEIQRVGGTKPIRIDVRIIAATNRTLIDEIKERRFREDLFHRLAVAVLKLPPLRERVGDMGILLDELLKQVNEESSKEPGYKQKKLSAAARNLALEYSWPGNVRELLNTLRRAAVWSVGDTIEAEDLSESLLPATAATHDRVFGRTLGSGFNLPELLNKVARHYLSRAMTEAANNKTKAATLVGLPSYQTFTNWLKKYEVS